MKEVHRTLHLGSLEPDPNPPAGSKICGRVRFFPLKESYGIIVSRSAML